MSSTITCRFEVSWVEDLVEACDEVLAGPMLLLIDGLAKIFVVDVRQYQVRSMEEPDLERVTRGAREGFVETALFNVNLIRRRVRDPNLRFEVHTVGKRSHTDIMIGYIADIASPEIVADVKARISHIDRDAIPMGGKNLEEYIFGTKLNPLPVTRYTERPDVAAAQLIEGHVIIKVDTTPFAQIVPSTIWHLLSAEEYFQNPPIGTYLRMGENYGILHIPGPNSCVVSVGYHARSAGMDRIYRSERARAGPAVVQFLLLKSASICCAWLWCTRQCLATSLGLLERFCSGTCY